MGLLRVEGRLKWFANSPHMRVGLLLFLVLLLAGCGRSTSASLIEVRDSGGFTLRYPHTWVQVRREDGVWFVPDHPERIPEVAEFILVATRASVGQLDDAAIRRAVFDSLPIQGVSGFQQDARTTNQVLWYKFEVTGSSGGQEWAAVGALVSGSARYRIMVCAKPILQWREGQNQCDEVRKTFQPGALAD